MNYTDVLKQRALTLARDRGAAERIAQQLTTTRQEAERLTAETTVLETTQALALELEKGWRKAYEEHVASTCSEGVSLVFGEPLSVTVESSIKAGASAVKFLLDNGEGATDILDDEGRSLAEVVAFLLRVISVCEARPSMERIITLDEAFGGVSDENVPALATLLRKLVDESDQQILFVTHNRSFADVADRVYEVERKGSVGRVKLLRERADSHLYEEHDG